MVRQQTRSFSPSSKNIVRKDGFAPCCLWGPLGLCPVINSNGKVVQFTKFLFLGSCLKFVKLRLNPGIVGATPLSGTPRCFPGYGSIEMKCFLSTYIQIEYIFIPSGRTWWVCWRSTSAWWGWPAMILRKRRLSRWPRFELDFVKSNLNGHIKEAFHLNKINMLSVLWFRTREGRHEGRW